MQITYSPSEVETIITNHILDTLQGSSPEDITSVSAHGDGSVTIHIGEEVGHENDTPPVVEKKTRRSRKNPQEAKHRPVEPELVVEDEAEEGVKEEEIQTSTGGPNGNSTPEPEEAVAEPEAQEEVVQEEVKAEEPAEKPAAKPSLFAGLKRS